MEYLILLSNIMLASVVHGEKTTANFLIKNKWTTWLVKFIYLLATEMVEFFCKRPLHDGGMHVHS